MLQKNNDFTNNLKKLCSSIAESKLCRFFRDADTVQATGVEPEKGFITALLGMNKVNLLIVVLATFLLRTINMMTTITLGVNADSFGPQLGAVRLAGLDWSYIAATVSYYGLGYYIFFTPVYMLLDDPFVIFLTIALINALLVSFFSIIIYTIAVLYFKLPDKILTAFAVAFTCVVSLFDGNGPWNEVPMFFVVWLSALMLLISVNSPDNKKRKNIATLCLVGILFWGMFVHVRLDVLVIIICAVTLLYFLCFKVWIVSPHIFYPVIAICHYLAAYIQTFIIYEVFEYADRTAYLGNIGLNPGHVFEGNLFSLRAFVDTVITNATTLITNTYGLAAVSIALLLFLAFRILKRLVVERERSDIDIGLSRDRLVVALVFAGCIIATMVGLYLRTAYHINPVYEGGAVWGFRFMEYVRYYVPYFGPLLLITLGYIHNSESSKRVTRICAGAFGLFSVLFVYVVGVIIVTVMGRTHTIVGGGPLYINFLDGSRMWAHGTGIVVVGFLLLFYFLASRRKAMLIMIPIYIFALSVHAVNVSIPIFNFVPSSDRMALVYTELKQLDSKFGLPNRIYTAFVGNEAITLQAMFPRFTVIPGAPEADDTEGVFVGPHLSTAAPALHERGYSPFFLPHDTSIWVQEAKKQEVFRLRGIAFEEQYGVIEQRLAHLIKSSSGANIYLNDLEFMWVYQSVFSENTISIFSNELGLLDDDMSNNVIIVRRSDAVVGFSDSRLLYDGLLIVTENNMVIDAVLEMGGVMIDDPEYNLVRFFGARNLTFLMEDGETRTWSPLLKPGGRQESPNITLPGGSFEVTITGDGLSDGSFSVIRALVQQIPMYNLNVSDELVSFSFTLETGRDRIQFITDNLSQSNIRIDSIELRITERMPVRSER